MRAWLVLLLTPFALGGCAAHRVHCTGRLEPINPVQVSPGDTARRPHDERAR
jgi:hypothetical protein